MTHDSTRVVGRRVESRVAEYLTHRGLLILEVNVERAGGEIDMIAVDRMRREPEYVFIEVRARSRSDLGGALETVDRVKQRNVLRVATAWLVERELWELVAVRFDVVGVAIDGDVLRVSWIQNAFEV